MSPFLEQGAIIRVTLQRQISVDVRDQKVLKTIICGEGDIRRVDLGEQDPEQEDGCRRGAPTVRGAAYEAEEQGFTKGNGEAGWFGTIPEEDSDEGDTEFRPATFE